MNASSEEGAFAEKVRETALPASEEPAETAPSSEDPRAAPPDLEPDQANPPDPDRALKLAIAAAVAAGDYTRAEALLAVLKETRKPAPVLSLRKGGA